MENYLLVRKSRDLSDEIEEESFKIIVVCQKKTEEFIGFFEGNDCKHLKVFNIEVELFEHKSLIRGKNVVSLFSSDDLTH